MTQQLLIASDGAPNWEWQANLVQHDCAFPATANDGRLTSRTTTVNNETVSYSYDDLGRLSTAQAPTWGLSFTNDR